MGFSCNCCNFSLISWTSLSKACLDISMAGWKIFMLPSKWLNSLTRVFRDVKKTRFSFLLWELGFAVAWLGKAMFIMSVNCLAPLIGFTLGIDANNKSFWALTYTADNDVNVQKFIESIKKRICVFYILQFYFVFKNRKILVADRRGITTYKTGEKNSLIVDLMEWMKISKNELLVLILWIKNILQSKLYDFGFIVQNRHW